MRSNNNTLDKIIKQHWSKKHRSKIILGVILIILIGVIFWISKPNSFSIQLDEIQLGSVTYGDFQEIIVANGTIEPKTTVLIDAKEGGTVLEIKAEEGQMMNAGDLLVTLNNESLILEYMQRETQIVEQINNLRNTRISLDQNLRTVEDQLNELENQSIQAHRKFVVDSALNTMNGIAKNDYLTSKENHYHLLKKTKTFSKRLQKDENYQKEQFKRIDASIQLMERNLEMIRSTIDEMSIKAPISGQLNSFNLEKGQVLQRNETIGRIDIPGAFIIRALVDQHYLNRVTEGQIAMIEYNSEKYNLHITKVQTTVENGQFEVLLAFDGTLPENIRRGQSFQVHIAISALTKAKMIPRGSFYQSSGGNFVYVVSKDKKSAIKRSVSLGKQNPEYYEVIEGLDTGEEIITSSYEFFKENDNLILNQNKE